MSSRKNAKNVVEALAEIRANRLESQEQNGSDSSESEEENYDSEIDADYQELSHSSDSDSNTTNDLEIEQNEVLEANTESLLPVISIEQSNFNLAMESVIANGTNNSELLSDEFLALPWPSEDQLEFGLRPKRPRKRRSDPALWNQSMRKKYRAAGKSYITAKKKTVDAKSPKPIDCSKCKLHCNNKILEDQRNTICSDYYSLQDYWRQRNYICTSIQKRNIDQRSTYKGKKTCSFKYSFMLNNVQIFVCKKFFLATLNVSEKLVRLALEEKREDGTYGGSDSRGGLRIDLNAEERKRLVRMHISRYPAVESHYVRKDTTRQFLEASLNLAKMYDNYVQQCNETNVQPVAKSTFKNIFYTEFNLAFHHPKKDQCAVCNKYQQLTDEQKEERKESFDRHVQHKVESREAKAADKERAAIDKTFRSATFDLQAVLYTPCSAVSSLFYKLKLCSYNLTLYEQALPHDGQCYFWTETDGKRGSNEIATCLFRYLSQLPANVKEVAFFSDSCSGQNRNINVAVAMLYAVKMLNVEVIEQKFLEPGHTQMECDSMHSAIETAKKNVTVSVPNEWIPVIRRARRSHPYNVHELDYTDFLNFDKMAKDVVGNRTHDTEKQKVNWLKMKVIRYEKQKPNIILFKSAHSETTFKEMDIGKKATRFRPQNAAWNLTNIGKKYDISEKKLKDLLDLCKTGAIRIEYHGFYNSLNASPNIRDALPMPDAVYESDPEEEY